MFFKEKYTINFPDTFIFIFLLFCSLGTNISTKVVVETLVQKCERSQRKVSVKLERMTRVSR